MNNSKAEKFFLWIVSTSGLIVLFGLSAIFGVIAFLFCDTGSYMLGRKAGRNEIICEQSGGTYNVDKNVCNKSITIDAGF